MFIFLESARDSIGQSGGEMGLSHGHQFIAQQGPDFENLAHS